MTNENISQNRGQTPFSGNISGLRVAVVGGGWAGCAAAVQLVRGGAGVTLFEQARTLGGRARRIEAGGRTLDNGQHILLGAYDTTLRLMRRVGVDPRRAVMAVPLQMRYPPGGMQFAAPRLPAPLHLLAALLGATGLERADKLAMARFSTTARWMGWRLDQDCTVAELLERYDQTPRLVRLMWRPLCLAALNTPLERASANVFLAVLRDSLGARRHASDMLLPRHDLTALFPDAAAAWLAGHGASVHTGVKVDSLAPADGGWRLAAQGNAVGGAHTARFDRVVLATSPAAAAALLAELPGAGPLAAQLQAFAPEPITTCYLQYGRDERLARPFFALEDVPADGRWGQFVFDRGQLDATQAGLFAVIISAASDAAALPQAALAEAIAAQLAQAFGRPALARPEWSKVVTEKRATYACNAGLARPDNVTPLPGLVLAGDYTAGDYPATLEMAVRSGSAAAKAVLPSCPRP